MNLKRVQSNDLNRKRSNDRNKNFNKDDYDKSKKWLKI